MFYAIYFYHYYSLVVFQRAHHWVPIRFARVCVRGCLYLIISYYRYGMRERLKTEQPALARLSIVCYVSYRELAINNPKPYISYTYKSVKICCKFQ